MNYKQQQRNRISEINKVLNKNIELLSGESDIICIDIAKNADHYGYFPLQLLVTILGFDPFYAGPLHVCKEHGDLSYKPRAWYRDDWGVLVKKLNPLSKPETARLIDRLSMRLSIRHCMKIRDIIIKHCRTKASQQQLIKSKLMDDECKLHGGMSAEQLQRGKRYILKGWFGSVLCCGPMFVARGLALDDQHQWHARDLISPFTFDIIHDFECDTPFYNKFVAFVLLWDPRMALIPGGVNENIDWLDFNSEYIGASENNQSVMREKVKILQKYVRYFVLPTNIFCCCLFNDMYDL